MAERAAPDAGETGALADFQRLQFAFTAHLRDPERVVAPDDVNDRRMQVYRRLLFNNLRSFIANGFPVLRSLYADADWDRLVRRFFAEARCHSPYFTDIAPAFIDYLQHDYQPGALDPPFMLELAHYEWVELELLTADETTDVDALDPHGDLLAGAPVLSGLARCFVYAWPVQRISPDFRPQEPLAQPLFMLIYRNADDAVKFIELNPASALLFERLRDNPENRSGVHLLESIAAQMRHPDPERVRQGGLQTLTRWLRLGVIAGVRA